MSITVSLMTVDDISSMYVTVKSNQDYLAELHPIQYLSYERFHEHYANLISTRRILIFAIKINGMFIGAIEADDRPNEYYVGYWIANHYRNKGIVSVALQSVMTHDLVDPKPIIADTKADNVASSRVLLKVGFIEIDRCEDRIYFRLDRP